MASRSYEHGDERFTRKTVTKTLRKNPMYAKERIDMSERKYEKYILTDLHLPEENQKRLPEYNKRAKRILWLEDFIIKGAPGIILSWYCKATEKESTPAHVHEYDEVVGFIGGDPDNPQDLGGEIDFWMDDEKYTLTKSCLVYCPKGLKHCPLHVVRADRPILFLAVSVSDRYYRTVIE
jgi:hypothetical protein